MFIKAMKIIKNITIDALFHDSELISNIREFESRTYRIKMYSKIHLAKSTTRKTVSEEIID